METEYRNPNKLLNISALTPAHGIEVTNRNPNKLFNISVLTPMHKHGFVADTPKATKTSTPNSLFKKNGTSKKG
ncbi:hypothetical protein HMPREF2955_05650 [Prevotella sp. HMSC073D09]|nr:hypothetical protein HMPREF2955_05650 [Prevotella sp. HMSC073D09]